MRLHRAVGGHVQKTACTSDFLSNIFFMCVPSVPSVQDERSGGGIYFGFGMRSVSNRLLMQRINTDMRTVYITGGQSVDCGRFLVAIKIYLSPRYDQQLFV